MALRMTRYGAWGLVLVLAMMPLGCTPASAPGTPDQQTPAAPKTEAPAAQPSPATPLPAAAAPAEPHGSTSSEAPAAGTVPAASASTAASAPPVGSSWKVGEFTVTFVNDKEVMVKGGKAATVAPNGLMATYTVDKGMVEVSALGKIYAGTWDGSNLVVDGQVGVRQ